MIGRTISHFEIIEKLGSGGMGTVFRAKDLELGRDVAIKVLREDLSTDPERLRRFEQEARSASALNHPNIITIYEIGKDGSTPYIAMELVEGKTLREVLDAGRLSTRKLLQFSTQIAEGLAKAHTAGIVHRDLKPENLMVTNDGFVKILDFGLAKLRSGPSETESEAATATKEGTVLGTVGYMSPEQAKGQVADFRSDQFSFGAILLEMATGKRAFQRDTAVETLSAIIKEEPQSLSELSREAPNVRTIASRCLSKEPEERYDSTRDLARDLKSIHESTLAPESVDVSSETRRRWPVGVFVAGCLVALLALAVGLNVGGLRDSLLGEAALEPIESIAVLPLDNISGDPEQVYFADGMTEELIAEISKIGALRVISRQSVMRFKGTDKPLPEIAQALNVDAVVEGSVRRAGDRVRITTQLVQAVPERHIWAESYERDLRDVLSLQAEVARAIAQEIKIELTAKEETLLSSAHPVHPEAHEAYLRGIYHLNRGTPEAYSKSFEYLQRAIEIDPAYALAYAGLSRWHIITHFSEFVPAREAMPKAEAAALKALELDENLAEAHNALGAVKLHYEYNWQSAKSEIERAIELNPSLPEARMLYGDYLTIAAQIEAGMEQILRALELDPLSVLLNTRVAAHLFYRQKYDEAEERLLKALELEPNAFLANFWLAHTYHYMNRDEESLASYKKALVLMHLSEVVDALEQGYAESGYTGAMRRIADSSVELSETRYITPAWIALTYNLADEKDKSLMWLETAYNERVLTFGLMLKLAPMFDSLRSDPRFQGIVRRMNFPE